MKTKKSPKADLEGKRPLFFTLGFIISLGIVLAAFSWKTKIDETIVLAGGRVDVPIEDIVIPRTEPEPPKPAPRPILIENLVPDLKEGEPEIDPNLYNTDIKAGDPIELSRLVFDRPAEPEADPVGFAEQMPEFPGGQQALLSFIGKNVIYPEVAREIGTQGKVVVRFVVNSDGSISEATVVRPLDELLDREAIRVVLSMPRWRPGFQNGKPVRVIYHVPINFVLQSR